MPDTIVVAEVLPRDVQVGVYASRLKEIPCDWSDYRSPPEVPRPLAGPATYYVLQYYGHAPLGVSAERSSEAYPLLNARLTQRNK